MIRSYYSSGFFFGYSLFFVKPIQQDFEHGQYKEPTIVYLPETENIHEDEGISITREVYDSGRYAQIRIRSNCRYGRGRSLQSYTTRQCASGVEICGGPCATVAYAEF